MNYTILLPVFNNHLLFKNYTYLFLKSYNLQDKCIMLIQNEEDAESYEEFSDIKQERTPRGKGASINFMMNKLPLDSNIVCIDDDVSGLMDVCGNQIGDVNKLFIEMFDNMNKEHITLGGFYPVSNGYFMKKQQSHITHLSFIVGSCFLFINKHIPLEIDNGKDDYIFSIDNFNWAGKVLRYNHIAVRYQYKAGIEKDGDLEEFVSKYKEYISYVRYHKKGTTSIVLKKEP